jgi:hypothetical protein
MYSNYFLCLILLAKPIDWAAIRAKLPYEVSDAAKAKREVSIVL